MFGADNLILSSPWLALLIVGIAILSFLEYKLPYKKTFLILTAVGCAAGTALLLVWQATLADALLFVLGVLTVRIALILWEGRRTK